MAKRASKKKSASPSGNPGEAHNKGKANPKATRAESSASCIENKAPGFSTVEITLLEKTKGPGRNDQLSKTIRSDGAGGYISDGSPCRMTEGKAWRWPLKDFHELGEAIEQFGPHQAIALGRMIDGLPDGPLDIVTANAKKQRHAKNPKVIARSLDYFAYAKGSEGLVLFDTDYKGVHDKVRKRIEEVGGLSAALGEVCPALRDAYRLVRPSTSSGLYNEETGAEIAGNDNTHTYVAIRDGSDTERFLKTFNKRCWLKGYGWIVPSKIGSALIRSIVDVTVRNPERIVFEGPPVVELPLAQDAAKRRAQIFGSDIIDSKMACPDLTPEEEAEYDSSIAAEKKAMGTKLKKAQKLYEDEETAKLAQQEHIPEPEARKIVKKRIENWQHHVLVASDTLLWDDADLVGHTVGDILRDPAKYEGETLADPIEGVSYGTGKAKVLLRREDGWPMIHSFAHGGTKYWLRWDFASIVNGLASVEDDNVMDELKRYLGNDKRVEISGDERVRLYELAAGRSGKTVDEIALLFEEAATISALEYLNREYCVIQSIGGKCRILLWEEGGPHGEEAAFQTFTDFRNSISNKTVKVREEEGKLKTKSIGEFWLHHPRRREYRTLIFNPTTTDHVGGNYNLWRGWGVEPRPGDWSHMKEHIEKILANGNADVYEYLLNWPAWAFQHPDVPAEAAVALQGDEGTGRGIYFRMILLCFGRHGLHITNMKHLTGQYNRHLMDKSYLFVDEAYWPGDKSAEGILKGVITEPTIAIEPKGIDVKQWPNRLHLGLASNNEWYIPIGHGARRWMANKVNNRYSRLNSTPEERTKYFGPLYAEMKNGGTAAMLYDLLGRSLGNWHPRDIVETEGLAAQMQLSLGPEEAWWQDLLQAGVLPGTIADKSPCKLIYQSYERHARNRGVPRKAAETTLGIFLSKRGVVKHDREGVMSLVNPQTGKTVDYKYRGVYEFPTLKECRENFNRDQRTNTQWVNLEALWSCGTILEGEITM